MALERVVSVNERKSRTPTAGLELDLRSRPASPLFLHTPHKANVPLRLLLVPVGHLTGVFLLDVMLLRCLDLATRPVAFPCDKGQEHYPCSSITI